MPTFQMLKQDEHREFKSSLGSVVSSRPSKKPVIIIVIRTTKAEFIIIAFQCQTTFYMLLNSSQEFRSAV